MAGPKEPPGATASARLPKLSDRTLSPYDASAPAANGRRLPVSTRIGSGTGTTAGAKPKASAASTKYRYVVLSGNESVLLTEAFQRRPWWEPAAAGDAGQRWNLWAGLNGQRFTNFELLPTLPAGQQADRQVAPSASRRLVNRLEEHRVICTKSGLAGVLAGIQQAAATPGPAKATAAAGQTTVDGSLADARSTQASTSGSGSGSGNSSKPDKVDVSWIPETYVVPAGPGAAAGGALVRFQAAFARHEAAGQRVWIAKPTSLNRGNGIEVLDSLERILAHIRSRPAGSSLILQKYIERPMLLGGRKFDIRAYVLVGPDGSVWFHQEAYCRTSSTPYDSSDLGNRSAHLTNDAVQKHLDSYNAFEDHCKLSLEELGPALRQAAAAATTNKGSPSPGANGDGSGGTAAVLEALDTTPGREAGLWGAMRRSVAALFSAAVPLLNPRRLAHCFELLGLDFMLDEDGGLYLIEVNTSPALFRAGAYLTDLLPRLVEEVVQKVIDPLFPPPPSPPISSPAPLASAAAPIPPPDDQDIRIGIADAAGCAASSDDGVSRAESKNAAVSASAPGIKALDGFIQVVLDEQFGAAAASAGGRVGAAATKASTRVPSKGPPANGIGASYRVTSREAVAKSPGRSSRQTAGR